MTKTDIYRYAMLNLEIPIASMTIDRTFNSCGLIASDSTYYPKGNTLKRSSYRYEAYLDEDGSQVFVMHNMERYVNADKINHLEVKYLLDARGNWIRKTEMINGVLSSDIIRRIYYSN